VDDFAVPKPLWGDEAASTIGVRETKRVCREDILPVNFSPKYGIQTTASLYPSPNL